MTTELSIQGPYPITLNDLDRSQTATHLADFERALEPLRDMGLRSMLDIGCGFGGLGRFAADRLGIQEVHGLDLDPSVISEARSKGVDARVSDVSREALGFADSQLDLVISLGMMDYLPTFDVMIQEMLRVLRPGGYVLVALPNLASWHNRLALVLGYQPRDVEFSTAHATGLMPWYRDQAPVGHIHSSTVGAFRGLMEYYGFQTVRTTQGSPLLSRASRPWNMVDRLMARRVTLARRFFYLGQKPPASANESETRS